MKRIIVEHYKDFQNLTVYTIRFLDEEICETDKFIIKYKKDYLEDIQIIREWLRNIGVRGAREQYLRFENNARAGPTGSSKLRIYLCRCHENLVILGGGGPKKGQKSQDGAETNYHFRLMNKIDKMLIDRIRSGEISYENDKLVGNLTFEIDFL